MTRYSFKLLSPTVQLYWVLKHGTYLAQRWEAEGGINLYHCADEGRGFFVEVGYNTSQHAAMVLRSFVSATPLENYTLSIELPEGL